MEVTLCKVNHESALLSSCNFPFRAVWLVGFPTRASPYAKVMFDTCLILHGIAEVEVVEVALE